MKLEFASDSMIKILHFRNKIREKKGVATSYHGKSLSNPEVHYGQWGCLKAFMGAGDDGSLTVIALLEKVYK